MSLPYSDPSNPALPSPLFSDLSAVRADHMRANNSAIWGNFTNLDTRLSRMETLVQTASSGGTLTLDVLSVFQQQITGTLAHTITLPVVSTLYLGFDFLIVNASTQNVTVNSSGGNLVKTLLPGKSVSLVCIVITGTTAASWAVVDTAINAESLSSATLSTDTALTADSDTLIPSQHAVKTYSDIQKARLDILEPDLVTWENFSPLQAHARKKTPYAFTTPANARMVPANASGSLDIIYALDDIWAAGYTGTIVRINRYTGAIIATISTALTSAVWGLVYDWVNGFIWAGGVNSQIIYKIDPATNTVVDNIDLGAGNGDARVGVFDGTYLWWNSRTSKKLFKIDPVTKAVAQTVTGAGNCFSLKNAFSGAHIYCPDFDSNCVRKVNISSGAITTINVDTGPWGVFWDGQDIWVSHASATSIYRIDGNDNATVQHANIGAAGGHSIQLTDKYFFVCRSSNNDLRFWDTVYGSWILSASSSPVGADPAGLCWDGAYLWVANYQSNFITRLKV